MDALLDPANRLDITTEFLALRSVLKLNQASYAKLFGMSKQALSKLEMSAGQSKMTFASILMISYSLKSITHHQCFNNFSEEQKDATFRLLNNITNFLISNSLNEEETNLILSEV